MNFLNGIELKKLWAYIAKQFENSVSKSTTINGKSLKTDVTLTTNDIESGQETWEIHCGDSENIID